LIVEKTFILASSRPGETFCEDLLQQANLKNMHIQEIAISADLPKNMLHSYIKNSVQSVFDHLFVKVWI